MATIKEAPLNYLPPEARKTYVLVFYGTGVSDPVLGRLLLSEQFTDTKLKQTQSFCVQKQPEDRHVIIGVCRDTLREWRTVNAIFAFSHCLFPACQHLPERSL